MKEGPGRIFYKWPKGMNHLKTFLKDHSKCELFQSTTTNTDLRIYPMPGPPLVPASVCSLPSLHQSDLVLDEETVAELPAGLRRFCRDKVNLLIPCVLEDI